MAPTEEVLHDAYLPFREDQLRTQWVSSLHSSQICVENGGAGKKVSYVGKGK